VYLILVVVLMLFCSTVTSYYWSQLDLMQQTCELYMQKQRTDLAIKAACNYGIAWLHENIALVRARGVYTLYLKEWPTCQAELVFECDEMDTGQPKFIKLSCKLVYAHSKPPKKDADVYSCVLSLSYDKILTHSCG
jgi:hypothetical protein